MDTTKPSVLSRSQTAEHLGIQTVRYSRSLIGYVEQGRKLIHVNDKYVEVRSGEIYHLESGPHHIENCPAPGGEPFREILFFYTPADLRSHFSTQESIARVNKLCSRCRNTTGVFTYPASGIVTEFFRSTGQYIEAQIHLSNPELGHMKLCELVHLLLAQTGCCVCKPVSSAVTRGENSLAEIVRENYLRDISIGELARLCGMSLSMFKNEFRKSFQTTPHKWITEQRLTHARLQLLTTNRAISDIADECRFNNSSHFIKLFKEKFDTTPAVYRRLYRTTYGDTPQMPQSPAATGF